MKENTIQEKIDKVKWLLNQTEKLNNANIQIGLEYFILKAIDDKFELEILDNIILNLLLEVE